MRTAQIKYTPEDWGDIVHKSLKVGTGKTVHGSLNASSIALDIRYFINEMLKQGRAHAGPGVIILEVPDEVMEWIE